MKPTLLLLLTFVFSAICSCTKDAVEGTEGTLVVESWINDGNFPIVLLSNSVPASGEEMRFDDLRKSIEYFAKVSVSDGEKEILLIGTKYPDYYPSYCYTTSELRGEAGKTYYLRITTLDSRKISASCHIPVSKPLLSVSPIKQEDGNYLIEVRFENNIEDHLYYRFFVRGNEQTDVWKPSRLGIIDGNLQNGINTCTVYNSGNQLFFSPGSIIHLRFCTMERIMYEYWYAFENLSIFATNPLLPATNNLPKVIDNAFGYWAGYGTYEITVNIPSS